MVIEHRLNEHKNSSCDNKRGRELRNSATSYERKLWNVLRIQSKLKNLRFRRQQPLHPYIADFACMEARLLIELDGFSHDARYGYDVARDGKLRAQGFSILRFTNDEVRDNVYGVVETILNRAEDLINENRKTAPVALPPP